MPQKSLRAKIQGLLASHMAESLRETAEGNHLPQGGLQRRIMQETLRGVADALEEFSGGLDAPQTVVDATVKPDKQ